MERRPPRRVHRMDNPLPMTWLHFPNQLCEFLRVLRLKNRGRLLTIHPLEGDMLRTQLDLWSICQATAIDKEDQSNVSIVNRNTDIAQCSTEQFTTTVPFDPCLFRHFSLQGVNYAATSMDSPSGNIPVSIAFIPT